MSTKVFLTGGTGYIGGSVLHTLTTRHPEYKPTVLLHNPPDEFRKSYPKVKVVKGSYDDADIITETASQAGIVVHCGDSDHEACVRALLVGLAKRSAPAFYIHLSGTMIVADWKDGRPGELNHRVWSDLDDVDAFWSMPEDAMYRNTELIIQHYFERHGDTLKTAVVGPPDLHGKGRGPGKKTSILLPVLVESIKKQRMAFYLNSGTNTRSWVHIDDLMQIYLKLVEAAAAGGKGADWNRNGYYFASTEEATQVTLAQAVGSIIKKHGRLTDGEPKQLKVDVVEDMLGTMGLPRFMRYMFTSNGRTRADRSRKVLGYEPTGDSLWKTLEEDVMASVEHLKGQGKI